LKEVYFIFGIGIDLNGTSYLRIKVTHDLDLIVPIDVVVDKKVDL